MHACTHTYTHKHNHTTLDFPLIFPVWLFMLNQFSGLHYYDYIIFIHSCIYISCTFFAFLRISNLFLPLLCFQKSLICLQTLYKKENLPQIGWNTSLSFIFSFRHPHLSRASIFCPNKEWLLFGFAAQLPFWDHLSPPTRELDIVTHEMLPGSSLEDSLPPTRPQWWWWWLHFPSVEPNTIFSFSSMSWLLPLSRWSHMCPQHVQVGGRYIPEP